MSHKKNLGKEHNDASNQNKKSGQIEGGVVREGWMDMDVFDENTAPYSVGGNQGEMSSTAAGKKALKAQAKK